MAQWRRGTIEDPKETVLRRRVTTLLVADLMLGVVLVWLSLMVQDIGYRIDNTNGLIEKLDLEYAELMAEMAQQTSPERLRRLAETELGLRVPRPGQVITIDAQP